MPGPKRVSAVFPSPPAALDDLRRPTPRCRVLGSRPPPPAGGEPPLALEFLATVPEHKLRLTEKPPHETRRA